VSADTVSARYGLKNLQNANFSQWAGNYWNIANWMRG